MKNKKLTTEQNVLIDSLVNEFIALNSKEASTGGIIDIGSILGKIERQNNFETEYDIAKKMYEIKLDEQIKADIKLMEPDLNKLGLKIKRVNKYVKIYCNKLTSETAKSYDEMCSFNYNASHYIEFKRDEFSRNLDSKFNIKGNFSSYHGGESYEDILQMVGTQIVKDRLGRMYLHNLKL